ncbi:MAG: double-strand break repair helicase AddA [Pseudomonadota bacterium]
MNLLRAQQDKAAEAAKAQLDAATPGASVWVAASAGTGKTKVLTDRVITLLLHGAQPSRLLCLTFTKAAAAEMANRLAQRLAGWTAKGEAELSDELGRLLGQSPSPEMLATARQLFARVLDAPGGMKIQTIHAFCQSVLGRFPLEAQVSPNFQVLDERSSEELLREAMAEVFARAQAEDEGAGPLAEAIATISAEIDDLGFTELLKELIQERARLGRLLANGGLGAAGRRLRARLRIAPETRTEALIADAAADASFDAMGLRLSAEALAEGGVKDRARGARITAWLAADRDQRARGFADYMCAYFTAAGRGPRFKSLADKSTQKRFAEAPVVLESEALRLEAVRDKINAVRVAQATESLLCLGQAIVAAYEAAKQARALVDYDDLILKTQVLLKRVGSAAWVHYKLDGGLEHILVDEAQDTNPEQWQVIAALAEEFFVGESAQQSPRTVFAVGDAKQSIFSFQRADPAAFARMREHFRARAQGASQDWRKVDLSVSFRSTSAVLRAVDETFRAEIAGAGVLFDRAEIRHDPKRVGEAGLVELWPPAAPSEDEPTEPWAPPLDRSGEAAPRSRLAQLIAARIWHWTQAPAGAHDPESQLESKGRRLQPGDVLVLVRRRNALVDELVRALKQHGVPVAGVDRMVLSEQLAVMDLVALGRVLRLPEDDMGLACVLKGPLIGLSEEDLFTLAHGREGTLWQALERAARGSERFAEAYQRLVELRGRADRQRPYELYGELLGRDGGRRQLLGRLGPEANDPIDEFLAQALAYERAHLPSLEGFLHWLEIGEQSIKRDMEHGGNVVRVMTVHGAKGLQAPLVILPDTLQVPQAARGLFWIEGDQPDDQLALWPLRKDYDGILASAARQAAAAAQADEYRRLLYVAMTRAEDRLYVCGWQTKTKAPESCWYRLIEQAVETNSEPFEFGADLEGGWGGPGRRLSQAQEIPPPPTPLAEAVMGAPRPLPGWTREPPPPEPRPPRPLVPSRPAEEPAALSPLTPAGVPRFLRGLLVHSLLQHLPELAPERRRAAGLRYLAGAAAELVAEEQAALLDEVLAILEDSRFAALFGPESRAEVPIAGLVPGPDGPEVAFGQLDRLVVGPQEVLVVDYKTNRPAPLHTRDIPSIYLKQLKVYHALLSQAYPGRTVRCALLWTEGPRLMQISDDLMAQGAP